MTLLNELFKKFLPGQGQEPAEFDAKKELDDMIEFFDTILYTLFVTTVAILLVSVINW